MFSLSFSFRKTDQVDSQLLAAKLQDLIDRHRTLCYGEIFFSQQDHRGFRALMMLCDQCDWLEVVL